MTDSPDPAAIPDFAPVPRRPRHDGWTPERQRGFIAALAETGCVSRAAKWVGMTPEGAYHLRRQPGAEGFRAAWSAALASGVQRLTDIAFERAIDGVAIPIFHKGEQVGERRAYNDRLLMWTLRHHAPERYGEQTGDTNAISPTTRARLHRQWEAERETGTADIRERRALRMIRDDLVVATSLSDKLSQMRERLDAADGAPDDPAFRAADASPPEPRRPDGEYDSSFRRELDAFDRLHPHVRDWTDTDAAMHEGWPAQPTRDADRDRLTAKLADLTPSEDDAIAARIALFGSNDPADWPPMPDEPGGAGEDE